MFIKYKYVAMAFFLVSLSSLAFAKAADSRALDASQLFQQLAQEYASEQNLSAQSLLLKKMQPLAHAGVDPAARFLAAHPDQKEQRFEWLYLSSLTGNAVSEFEIAQIYLSQEDEVEATRWLKRALQHQLLIASDTTQNALTMGAMLEWSVVHFGMETDLSTAMGWYALAAQDSHPVALYALGRASLLGQGMVKDTQVAKSLLMAAVSANSPQASELLTLLKQI